MRIKREMLFGENYRESERKRQNPSWVSTVVWRPTWYKVKQYKLMKK